MLWGDHIWYSINIRMQYASHLWSSEFAWRSRQIGPRQLVSVYQQKRQLQSCTWLASSWSVFTNRRAAAELYVACFFLVSVYQQKSCGSCRVVRGLLLLGQCLPTEAAAAELYVACFWLQSVPGNRRDPAPGIAPRSTTYVKRSYAKRSQSLVWLFYPIDINII